MHVFKCDACGKETILNPKQIPLLDEDGKQVVKREVVGGKYREIPQFEDEFPRTYIVRLSVGNEVFQKDFCKEHLDEVLPELDSLRKKLLSYEDK